MQLVGVAARISGMERDNNRRAAQRVWQRPVDSTALSDCLGKFLHVPRLHL